MKRHSSVMIALLLTAAAMFGMSGCDSQKPADSGTPKTVTATPVPATEAPTEAPVDTGFLYVPVQEYLTNRNYSVLVTNYHLKDYIAGVDGYVCIVNSKAPAQLVIPDEHEGKPVVALTGAENTRIYLESVQIGRNVKCIFKFLYDNDSGLKEIVVPENVLTLDASFCYLSGATITLEGNPSMAFPFIYSKNLKLVVRDAEVLRQVRDSGLFDFEKMLTHDDVELGTKEYFEFSKAIDPAVILEKGVSHFQETLDPEKEIAPEQAGEYASFLDGPIVSMVKCPAIDADDYNTTTRSALLAEAEPEYLDVRQAAERYADDYYSPKTESPKVYFVVEKTGGKFAGYQALIYYMHYRISVRDIETDELLCWFRAVPGYGPTTVKVGGVDSGVYGDNGRSYLRAEDGSQTTELYCVHRYFPGK